MVRLYKELYKNGVGMFVDPDIDPGCLIFKFKKNNYMSSFMVSLYVLESRKFSLEDELLRRLKDFIYYVRTEIEPFERRTHDKTI